MKTNPYYQGKDTGAVSPSKPKPWHKKKIQCSGSAIVLAEPLIVSGSHNDREERGQRLSKLIIEEVVPLLIQVRQDFLVKQKDETICGVKTWSQYCSSVLHISESHARRLIAGKNPASAKHDGSRNRKPKPSAEEPPVPPLKHKNSDGTTTPITPAEFTAGDALVAAKQFLASAVSHLSPQDKDIFYRSLSLHIGDILNAASANPKDETFTEERRHEDELPAEVREAILVHNEVNKIPVPDGAL